MCCLMLMCVCVLLLLCMCVVCRGVVDDFVCDVVIVVVCGFYV